MNMQLLKSDTSRYIAFFGVLLLLMLLGRFEFTHQLVINIALIFVFAVISYVDWQTHRIPNILLLPLAALALILVLMQPGTAWMRLAGGIFAFVPFMLTAVVRPKHLGGGDIKLETYLIPSSILSRARPVKPCLNPPA